MKTSFQIPLRSWLVGAALIIAGLNAAAVRSMAQSPAVYFKANP